MTAGTTLFLVSAFAFASVALLVLATAEILSRRELIRQRYRAAAALTSGVAVDIGERRSLVRLEPSRIGLDPAAYRRLRLRLIRAGIFHPDGPVLFTLLRWGAPIVLISVGALLLALLAPGWNAPARLVTLLVLGGVAFIAPAALLSRRAREHQLTYQVAFPDLLDMLVVCINAGLSLEAALDRIARELGPDASALRVNLDLMAAESRAGRSTADALRDFADRLDLPEARSLASLLQQTIELGTDVATALTTFSDEMRDKRMSRAEERAAALPPKLTLPLGLFIFPVVLIVVLTPAVVRIMRVAGP